MIGAAETRGIAVTGAAQPVAAVPADIEKGAHDAVAAAHDQHRVLAHPGREKVARPRDLALVAQEQPAAGKDLLQFLFIDLLLDEDAAADEAAVGVDQRVHVRRHQGSSNSRM